MTHSTNTTRRAFLSITVAAVVTPAAIVTPALAANPDAEIIAAGEAFEALFGKYLDQRFVWARLARAARLEMEAAYPNADDEFDGLPGKNPKWDFHSLALERNGAKAASDHLSTLWDQMLPLEGLIRDGETSTVEGLRAKMLVAIRDCLPICATHDGNLNFEDDRSHWSLFIGAMALTGLSGTVENLIKRLQADATISADDGDADEVA